MIRHTLDELAIQKTLKLSNDLEVDVMDDGSAVMRTKRGVVNLSPKNYKILSRSIKQGKMESVNEAKREIGGYYLMKQVKDWIADAKSDRETKLVNALQYLYKELEKNRDIELNIDDINYFLNTSNGKKHKKNISTKMINSLFEGKLNEKKWDISQKTQGGTDFRNTMAFHSRELQKVVSLYKNRHKVNKEEMKYYMNIWMKGLHQRLKSLGVL